MKRALALVLVALAHTRRAEAEPPALAAQIADAAHAVLPVYQALHAHPELSGRERATAKRLAAELRQRGFTVSEGVGGTGVVGVLRNGPGRTVMLRTELDALPVAEATGLPYASRVRAEGADGRQSAVMHACGHDLHMAAWLATARVMAGARGAYHGTLLFVAQPAEETLKGAKAMLADGLFTRFPRPDAALAIHTHDIHPTGSVSYTLGPFAAGADSIDVTLYGRGGHGAYPHLTVDPIVLAARVVLGLQTLVARERDPQAALVISVGALHAGEKHNVIPSEARLALTVRSFSPEVRARAFDGLTRTLRGEAEAMAAPREPELRVVEHTEPTVNDVALTQAVIDTLTARSEGPRPIAVPPEMGAEDFSAYGAAGVPSVYLGIGVVEPARYAAWRSGGPAPGFQHGGSFAPDLGALPVAVEVEVQALLTLLAQPIGAGP